MKKFKHMNSPYINFSMLFNEVPWMPDNPYGNDPNKLDEITNEAITYYSRNYFCHLLLVGDLMDLKIYFERFYDHLFKKIQNTSPEKNTSFKIRDNIQRKPSRWQRS